MLETPAGQSPSAKSEDAAEAAVRRDAGRGRIIDVLGLVALVSSAIIASLFVPASPFAHLDDPTYGAVIATLPFIVALVVVRVRKGPGSRATRGLLALFLAAMPLVYIESWIRFSGTPAWLAIEIAGLVVFATIAVVSYVRLAWLLPVGLVAHGLLWDAWHHGHTTFVPDWYAVACLVADLGLAVFAATEVRRA